MAATNYSIFKGQQIESFKMGSTAWSAADYSSTTNALDTTFASNNATPIIDLVGDVDDNSPVESEAWVKQITFSGNERTVDEEDLVGTDTNGSQNKEVIGGAVSKIRCEVTMVYRNNVPFSAFNDTTKCALLVLDNDETSGTGVLNIAMNNITMVHVGSLDVGPTGAMQQRLIFDFVGGISGSPISVTQASPSETWSKVVGGDYAEEVRLS